MAYKTAELLQKAIEAAKKHQLIFIEEVVSFLPCSKPTFYEHKLQENKNLIDVISENRYDVTIARDRVKITSKNKNKTGYVYIVQHEQSNYYKIGISKNDYAHRLSALQSGNPYDLYMIYVCHCEKFATVEAELHKKYKSKRVRGEWFKLTPDELKEVIAYIETKKQIQYELNLN